MEQVVKVSAFVLLGVGTLGLLTNEFIADWGRAATLAFASMNVVGLATLAFAYWGRK